MKLTYSSRRTFASILAILLILTMFLLLRHPTAADSDPPTVNGLFYGDGDNNRYTLFNTSYYDSELYTYYDMTTATLYVALVVNPDVNDNVFTYKPKGGGPGGGGGDSTAYMESVGWGSGGGQQRGADVLTNSEFAEFTFACNLDSGPSWSWRQSYGCQPAVSSDPWTSSYDCGPGAGHGAPPSSFASSTSFVWNINNYRSQYGTTAPPSGSPPWNMYTYGDTLGEWKSPFSSSDPDTVPGDYSGYSTTYEWEWRMIYEWSLNLETAGCGNNALYLVTGLSHHSPMKEWIVKNPNCDDESDDPENDCFPEGGGQNPLSDWGDLPDSYGTISDTLGARHYLTVNGPYLGQDIRSETDGQPSTYATGDGSEEDGISFDLTSESLEAYVSNSPGVLGGWFDWNNDGDFDDSGEYFSWNVVTGTNVLTFTAGTGYTDTLYARFRIFSDTVDAPGGNLDATDYFSVATTGEVEDYRLTAESSIGNRVWVDEDSDGYQDAGEVGIPNVQVNLYDAKGNLVATTTTDSDGRYLFPDLWSGTYYVDVLDGTGNQANTLLSTNMTQTPPSTLEGADFGNQAHATAIPSTSLTGYSVTVGQNEENITADFGYNYRPTNDVNNGTNTGAIGDRVWSDADGDGVQDPDEPGLAGVTVTLYHDPDGDGVYDTVYGTTTTDANGNYLFDNLPAGAYTVEVTPPSNYTQTGDPDDFGQTASDPDNLTTTPIILGPGDVFLNADFGYQPPASEDNSVGDKVWFDADADGVEEAGEPGIPGVTVTLIDDTDGDGTWDSGEPIIATTTTDGDGDYLFSGVPDGNYLVWVNDVDNVLDNKEQTYDSNGASTPNISSVALDPTGASSTGISNDQQDFGYTAPDQATTTALIGDRVWLDIDGDTVQDTDEPGLEGILVELYDDDGNRVASMYTDQNGNYAFGNLAAYTYTVVVNPPDGITQTYDADGITVDSANRSTEVLSAGEINLAQDFGYRGTGTIGNLVWEDLNADGNLDTGESGIEGVTLDLYWDQDGDGEIDPGEPLMGSTTTASDGSYLFSGLPTDDGGGDAQFVVAVTDEAQVLNGYWHSEGTAGSDNNSQTDPYAVTLTTAAPNNLTADFGYYVQPAALGNRVWQDSDQDGIQDSGEPGIAGVTVTLTIEYDNGITVTVVTTTDSNGFYSFANLLLDEDLASSTSGTATTSQPVYTISVATPDGYAPTQTNQGSDDMLDSDSHSGVDGLVVQGQTDVTLNSDPTAETDPIATYDFGFYNSPTAVDLVSFSADAHDNHITLRWETANELDLIGFNLYRSTSPDGPWEFDSPINSDLILAQALGDVWGASYQYLDDTAEENVTYYYLLEDLDIYGSTGYYGPASATIFSHQIFLPLVSVGW